LAHQQRPFRSALHGTGDGGWGIFNRIARLLSKASQQFDALNPDRALPNILVFVNHDDMSGINDVIETVTGHFTNSEGERSPTMLHLSEGYIKDAKLRIDAYVWMDGETGRVEGTLLTESHPAHRDAICHWLGHDPAEICRV